VPLTVVVPAKAKGVTTQVALETGVGDLFGSGSAKTFDQLLRALANAVPGEAVRGRLGTSSKPLATASVRVGAPIDAAGFMGSVKVS
jgi:hypothetical protein